MKTRPLPQPFSRLIPDTQAAWLLAAAFALAALLWANTASLQAATREFLIPLTFSGIPQGMVVTGDMTHGTVAVVVRGTPELLRRVTLEDLQVRIDLASAVPGPVVHEIGPEDLRLPSSVEFERVVPSALQFTVERKTRREILLEPNFSGRPPTGLQVISWALDPPQTLVEGPESVLAALKRIPTTPVPLEGHNQGFETVVAPSAPSTDLQIVDPQGHRLVVRIGETRGQRSVSSIPVIGLHAVAGLTPNLAPASLSVMVEGPRSLILHLGPGDFRAEVDLRSLSPGAPPCQLKPAVRLADPARGAEVEITSWIPKFVDVTVRRAAGGGEEAP